MLLNEERRIFMELLMLHLKSKITLDKNYLHCRKVYGFALKHLIHFKH